MQRLIDQNREEIERLCRLHRVRRLAAFGSVLRSDFNPASSDADFLVAFEPMPASERLQHFLRLRAALSDLLARPVDLVEDGVIRNPYILKSVTEHQQILYAG